MAKRIRIITLCYIESDRNLRENVMKNNKIIEQLEGYRECLKRDNNDEHTENKNWIIKSLEIT